MDWFDQAGPEGSGSSEFLSLVKVILEDVWQGKSALVLYMPCALFCAWHVVGTPSVLRKGRVSSGFRKGWM